jgi:hypothetical protein
MSDATDLESLKADAAPDFDPAEAARMLGLTDMQWKFAEARRRGANKTQAAREAGYAGQDRDLRSTASKVDRTEAVQAYLKWAETSGAGVSDEPLDSTGLRQLLTRHARGADKSASIRAIEVLHRINAADQERDAGGDADPFEILDNIARTDLFLAISLAKENGVDWVPSRVVDPSGFDRWSAEQRATCERTIRQVQAVIFGPGNRPPPSRGNGSMMEGTQAA